MKVFHPLFSRMRHRALTICAGGAILFFSVGAEADEEKGQLTHDIIVGASHDVQLKSGQVVRVMKHSGQTVVIMVRMPDGSSGIYQVEAAAVEPIPSTPPAPSPGAQPTTTNATPVTPAPPLPASNPSNPPPAAAAPAPVAADPNLPEDQVTLIHVSWPQDSKLPAPYEGLDSAKAGSYSYRLYLPPGYYAHPRFHYPTLFIMSPDGNASLGKFETRAREEGWIVVMFVEAKNGDWGPIYGDMLAAFADVSAKVRIQEGLKFATGFSGGARGTSMLTQFSPGFNGELLQGAGFALDDTYLVRGIPRDHPYAVFMIMGSGDSNLYEVNELKNQLHNIPFKSATFEGGHSLAPQAQCNEGLDWLIEQALAGDSPSDDLRECGTRQFLHLAKRVGEETDSSKQTDKTKALVALGENLNFAPGSPEALELKKLKDSIPFSP